MSYLEKENSFMSDM